MEFSLICVLLFWANADAYMVQDTGDAMQYLSRFGYIGKDTASSMNIVDAGSVLRKFQKMAGIEESGVLDNATMGMMNMPRCGNKDMDHEMIPDDDDPNVNNVRRKRYKLNESGAKWKKRELTYHVGQFSPRARVSPEQIERDIAQAFKLWASVTNLQFTKTKDKNADIFLGFTPIRHNDNFPFDGPGKTLAHAFPPGGGLGGDVHFDEHEEWSVDSPKGTNVLFVAVHEIGHSLGLSHSEAKGAIMQAFYGGYRPHLKLHPDDVAGVQALYGPRGTTAQESPMTRVGPQPQPTSRPQIPITWRPLPDVRPDSKITPPPFGGRRVDITRIPPKSMDDLTTTTTTARPSFERPDLCRNSKIDAITAMNDGFIYAFSGYYVFQINPNGEGISAGWPSRIEFKFKGLEPNIEAALTRPNGKTFFFKGGKYWRFTGLEPDKGYPKSISKHFPGIPDHLDAAFENKHNGQMYFIKGDKFWRFDPLFKAGKHVSDIYPLPTDIWKLNEPSLDAALSTSKGDIYFFKDDKIYRFEEKDFELAKGTPAYPHSARTVLYGCGKSRSDRNSENGDYPNNIQYSEDNEYDYEGNDEND